MTLTLRHPGLTLLSAAVALPALLGSCGTVPIPPVPVPDQVIRVSAPLIAGNQTVYQLSDVALPPQAKLSSLLLSGTSRLTGPDGTPPLIPISATAEVYASVGAPSCPKTDSVAICSEPNGEKIGTLKVGQVAQAFSLKGQALDEGARAGTLWLGLRLTEGQIPAGSRIVLEKLELRARL